MTTADRFSNNASLATLERGRSAHRPPVDVRGAAVYSGFSEGYLNKLRSTGGGPIFIKRAGVVRYDPDDLDAWLASLKRRSTSDAGAA